MPLSGFRLTARDKSSMQRMNVNCEMGSPRDIHAGNVNEINVCTPKHSGGWGRGWEKKEQNIFFI